MRNLTKLIFAAATLAAATSADAKPHRVVVIDFDGLPRQLADTGRANVVGLLGQDYDMVPTKKWEAARAQAPGKGPSQWKQAAKKSGVDAVVEGWINSEGRHHTLTVSVRDAITGNEIDNVSVQIGDKGLSEENKKQLQGQLEDILGWVDSDSASEDVHQELDDVTKQPKLGAHSYAKKSSDSDDDGDDSDRDRDRDDRDSHRRRPKHTHKTSVTTDRDDDDRPSRNSRRHDDDRDDRRDDRDDDRPSRSSRRSERDDDDRDSRDRDSDTKRVDIRDIAVPGLKTQVAAADATDTKNTNDLLTFFPKDTKEADVIAAAKAPRIMRPTPKVFLQGGLFIESRGMGFTHNPPDSQVEAPDYPAAGVQGLAIGAAIYPAPLDKLSYDPSGIGFSFNIQKSVGATLDAYDPDANTYGTYTVDHTAYEGAIRYRYPTDLLIVEGDISYGQSGYALGITSPSGIQIPDVNYKYIGLGGTVDLKVTDRTRAGFGAHYMYMLDTGDVADETWYGSGNASGIKLEAHFQIPLNDMLYLRAQLDYTRVSMDFEQSGDISNELEIGNITDSSIGGSAQVGVAF
ncbi:MAG: autotransporter outer membrane beta-barrel domain-containing protein [Kofleriaceae bacterium]